MKEIVFCLAGRMVHVPKTSSWKDSIERRQRGHKTVLYQQSIMTKMVMLMVMLMLIVMVVVMVLVMVMMVMKVILLSCLFFERKDQFKCSVFERIKN